MYLIILKMNDDKPVLAECTVFLKPDGVQIISKDEGVSFDMSDDDISTVSLSAYIVASYLEKRDFGNRHLTTMSFTAVHFLLNMTKERRFDMERSVNETQVRWAGKAWRMGKGFCCLCLSLTFILLLYDNTNGLPTSDANAIVQTADGFIWIGSYGGLIRFNGGGTNSAIHFR